MRTRCTRRCVVAGRVRRASIPFSRPLQVATWPFSSHKGPIYNTRDIVAPAGQLMATGPFTEVLQQRRELPPGFELQTGDALPAEFAEPYEGASRVLTWRTRIILSAGHDQRHPLSSKVEVTLVLAELAREIGLSPEGVALIKLLCGPRYTAGTDTLRLVSQRYYTREDNRRDLLRIVDELIDEAAKEGGLDAKAPGAKSVLARQARQRAARGASSA